MIKPLADRVVIEPKEAETKTASGLYIPDTAKEKPQQGKVVAAGPGKKDEPMEVKVGDNVLYGKYSGTEVKLDGVEYTKTIAATKGRASYIGERSIGHQDPGATSFTFMLEVIEQAL